MRRPLDRRVVVLAVATQQPGLEGHEDADAPLQAGALGPQLPVETLLSSTRASSQARPNDWLRDTGLPSRKTLPIFYDSLCFVVASCWILPYGLC